MGVVGDAGTLRRRGAVGASTDLVGALAPAVHLAAAVKGVRAGLEFSKASVERFHVTELLVPRAADGLDAVQVEITGLLVTRLAEEAVEFVAYLAESRELVCALRRRLGGRLGVGIVGHDDAFFFA
ncbi:hypothetical protein STTU_0763 [Streptomyces sp. Tu6071]|nr:hypothetical protein STTU_0763 [Streptomyces sp. Tu6071]